MSIEKEKAGLAQIIDRMKKAGWNPYRVWDGGENQSVLGRSTGEIAEVCCSTGDASLYFDNGSEGHCAYLVWGNSPEELIADNSMGGGFEVALDAAIAEVFPEE